MAESARLHTKEDIAFESFGVRMRVSADTPEVLERIPGLLPPDAKPCPPSRVDVSLEVRRRPEGSYDFMMDGSPAAQRIDLDFALTLLEAQVRIHVGLNAPSRIFVHAGVVAHEGRVIVLPGLSMAGKTTLVLALVRAGAVYYSDEFAVLDERGLVHPYAKPVSIRDGDQIQSDHEIERFGGVAGDEALEVNAVVFAEYRPGAEWSPIELSPGRAALTMFRNTLAAIKRSEEAMRTIKLAVDGALLLEGDRGEASEMAQPLLHRIAASP
jgi:hypothetical protein